ncbi:KDP operon transcriptional regulatory protein KdpE [Corynebacterium ciconiae DSM 44920]|uniref:response regulator n=1 Tax=Corynebacterium ciconiae TaxID=227319 RepID=UPI00036A7E71|nr:response regulator transcription factor [Corynebacterium ciconiae]WKD60102.1 KDP operon transcriptional regulatory protein KdpE [Corynebacterium ciconiae DSM 44920]
MTEQQHIVVVEDDQALGRTIAINLKARGYRVSLCTSAQRALQVVQTVQPSCILLDLGLPDVSGFEVLRTIRQWSAVPIIIVSARHMQEGKIEALDAGADDYITKPFAIGELLARIRATLRRAAPVEAVGQPVIHSADGRLEMNLADRSLLVEGQPTRLTPTQWAIVDVLLAHRGRLVSKLDLLHAVWGENYNKEMNYLRVYISQLRQKIEPNSAEPRYILTEPGAGYRLMLD